MTPATKTALSRRDTIDQVIEALNDVVDGARREGSRLGYFAALYRNVTIEVKRGIAQGRFDDGGRMERFDVVFAGRYLAALESYRRGERTSQCWVTCFQSCPQWRPIVLQHLLLGMNAHINLDLAVAAATTAPGQELAALRRDFDEINNILSAMVGGVQYRLSLIWPWMWLLDRIGGRTQNAILNFSIEHARRAAWAAAERLAFIDPGRRDAELEELDRSAARIAQLVRYPPLTIRLANLWVRLGELRDNRKIIDCLC
jgi:Family of unknown function (DUF5995)